MRLYWDPVENIPLVDRRCSHDEPIVVSLSKVSDPRPATEWDLKLLRDTLDTQLGAGAYRELIMNEEVVLLGRVPYMDTAYEVITDGVVMGHLFFDVLEFKWYFKPNPPSISRIGHRFEKLEEEGRRNEILRDAKPDDPKYVLLRNGLAERVGDKFVVIKEFKPSRNPIPVKSSWAKVVSMNEPCVLSREFESIRMLWRLPKGRKIVLSFSGGKDSSVLLELARRSELDFLVYFNDTGLELPETVSFVESVGFDILGDAGDSFWRNLEHFGPPARDYRWCCKLLKLAPTYRALKHLKPALTLVGQRKYESSARMRSPYFWENSWLPGFITAAPINDWSNLQAWLYINLRKIRINPLYSEGFERLGCYLCPASRLWDYERLKKKYPSLWEVWESRLRNYAQEHGYSECWLKYGIWRWVRPPNRISRLCDSGERTLMRVSLSGNSAKLEDLDNERFENLSKSVSRSIITGVKLEGSVTTIHFKGDPLEVLGVALRANFCGGCGLCSDYCETEAIKLGPRASIDLNACRSCGKCNEVCPLSAYAKKLISLC